MNKNTLKIFAAFILTTGIISQGLAYRYIPPRNSSAEDYNSTKSVTAGCITPSAATEMDLNNVRALIFTGGDMWWDLADYPKYEIPKGSGKHSLFAGAIWIGGTDVNGQLRVAAARYRANGTDYFSGPLKYTGNDRGTTTAEECVKYDKHFVITRNEVAEFRAWWRAVRDNNQALLESQFASYSVPRIITEWPAINTAPDYDPFLAPFHDENDDLYYNPEDGDYPLYDLDKSQPCNTHRRIPTLYGDKTLWWVYNDRGNIHTESKGASIGMEIRAQYFTFATNDELNNMTFGNYQLINRSTYTLQDCYFGVWTDADLGRYDDDFVGTDVNRGLGYLYNGNDQDGNGSGNSYGSQPPAIGVDFFEGPYQDADGKDNLSNWDPITGLLNCSRAPLIEGSINGLNFEDGIVDNERWGMRRFVYFNNGSCVQCDPDIAVEYYYYLRGYWKNGVRMTYGGTGYLSSSTYADFMFPDVTDPCGWGTGGIPQSPWSEFGENNTPFDRRFIHSAGPFTLEPGATNDITVGMVWARATAGGAWASVAEVQRADDKAQRLFEVCFKIVDGPHAPELQIIELDRRLLFHISNNKGSNNYLNTPEDYREKDPFIVCPTSNQNCDQYFTFQGYQIFQLKDQTCSVNDIENPEKARLVFQCDKKDTVSKLINYEYDNDLGVSVPKLKVDGSNTGIQHSFTLTDDAFAAGDKRLVNHKTYYYVAIAYGYNNYKQYTPDDPMALDGQKKPYLPSRTGATGAIKTYSTIPHIASPANNGTILNSQFGDGPKIIQVEGHGNGNNEIELTQNTINRIMQGPPWIADSVEYSFGKGPVKIKVIDPLNVPADDFCLRLIPDSTTITSTDSTFLKPVTNSKWMVYKLNAQSKNDTIYSDSWITYLNEQLISKWGISITISQIPWPCKDDPASFQNGYISSSIQYTDPAKRWLNFIPDVDGCGFPNWIRCGTTKDPTNSGCDDINQSDGTFTDKDQYYEKIVDGTWAPYGFSMEDNSNGPIYYGTAYRYQHRLASNKHRLSSVLVVISADKSKWTRCPVIELCEYDIPNAWKPGLSEGYQYKFGIRRAPSVDKNGNPLNTLLGDSTNSDYSNYIASRGMGWFPGYAIDVETGTRLNMAFGEDSRFPGQNGRDMMWNPTNNIASDLFLETGGIAGDLYYGGKHVIYVWGNNYWPTNTNLYMPAYDGGKYLYTKLFPIQHEGPGATNGIAKRDLWQKAMWVSMPYLSSDVQMQTNPSNPYYFIQTDVTVKICVANPYQKSVGDFKKPDSVAVNNNLPMYYFSLKDLVPVLNDDETAENSLDLIKIVPNPYYGYSSYERSQLEYKVKITNLPQKCTISIFTINGTLIRRYKKDSQLSYQDWDLKNEYGITIASGMYIIHIDAPGIGEKILKWFGALRPIDLNDF